MLKKITLSAILISSTFASDLNAFKDGFYTGFNFCMQEIAKLYPEKLNKLRREIEAFNLLKQYGLIDAKVEAKFSRLTEAGMSEERLKVILSPLDLKKIQGYQYLYEKIEKLAKENTLQPGYYLTLPASAPDWVKGLLYFTIKRTSAGNEFMFIDDEGNFYAGYFYTPYEAQKEKETVEKLFPDIFGKAFPVSIVKVD